MRKFYSLIVALVLTVSASFAAGTTGTTAEMESAKIEAAKKLNPAQKLALKLVEKKMNKKRKKPTDIKTQKETKETKGSGTGIWGILSALFGIISLLIWPLGLLAIGFGLLGIGEDKSLKILAYLGIALGVISSLVLWLILAVIL